MIFNKESIYLQAHKHRFKWKYSRYRINLSHGNSYVNINNTVIYITFNYPFRGSWSTAQKIGVSCHERIIAIMLLR